ncbi:surface presentation of antigens family protein, partial [Vibrio parahaemolyticus AQ3810]
METRVSESISDIKPLD